MIVARLGLVIYKVIPWHPPRLVWADGRVYKKKFLKSKNQPIKLLHVSKLVNFAKVLTSFLMYLK
jgi:hypothetical protein